MIGKNQQRENGQMSFRAVAGCRLESYSSPSVEAYEAEKGIRVLHTRNAVPLGSFTCACNVDRLLHDRWAARCWDEFFGPRVRIAGSGGLPCVSAMFPGHTVPGPGNGTNGNRLRYRGSLLLDQYARRLSLDAGISVVAESSEDNSAIPYKAKTLLIEDAWPWRFVERPILSFVELHKSGDEKPARKADSHPSLDMLDWKSGHLLAEGSSPAAGVLASIHRAWTKTTIPAYADEALAVADAVIEHEKGRALNQWLPLLFELEGFASHLTYTKDLRIFSSGFFANNWLEVGLLELSQFRATELCVRERLLDEIVNLTTRGFAPVVINEFRCVADGNHRLTAAWLWNLLKQCHDLKWDVGDDDFQRAVADFAGRHARGMGAVVLHEVLDHLGAFLTTRGLRSRLMGEIRPALSRFRVLGELPVVLLPEYLSGAVLKDPYDRGEATIRIEPSVYEFIQQVPDAVLPARASYHFTDCVLLPWFSVLSPADGTCSIRLRRKMGRRPPVRRFRGRGQEVVAETGLARTGSWRG